MYMYTLSKACRMQVNCTCVYVCTLCMCEVYVVYQLVMVTQERTDIVLSVYLP